MALKHEIQFQFHYLPYRHIMKEHSTTPIRAVIDASAKLRVFSSLNDCLKKGKSFSVLIRSKSTRFRVNKFRVTGSFYKFTYKKTAMIILKIFGITKTMN